MDCFLRIKNRIYRSPGLDRVLRALFVSFVCLVSGRCSYHDLLILCAALFLNFVHLCFLILCAFAACFVRTKNRIYRSPGFGLFTFQFLGADYQSCVLRSV